MTALLFGVLVMGAVLTGITGCASTAGPAEISVEGTVTTRGNEPFTAYILETDDQNSYVLVFDESAPEGIQTPVRMRVSGVAYGDTWQGRSYTHLRAGAYEALP